MKLKIIIVLQMSYICLVDGYSFVKKIVGDFCYWFMFLRSAVVNYSYSFFA